MYNLEFQNCNVCGLPYVFTSHRNPRNQKVTILPLSPMHDYDGVYEYRFEIDSENTLTARDIMGHAVGNYPVSMESLLGDYVPHEPSHFLEGGN